MARRGAVPLLVDFTHLATRWTVLQVSFPWQGRALPLYRLVFASRGPEVGQKEQVRTATAFLRAHLPAPLARYVLVMDRGYKPPKEPGVNARDGRWLLQLYDRNGTRTEVMVRKPVQKPCCSENMDPYIK